MDASHGAPMAGRAARARAPVSAGLVRGRARCRSLHSRRQAAARARRGQPDGGRGARGRLTTVPPSESGPHGPAVQELGTFVYCLAVGDPASWLSRCGVSPAEEISVRSELVVGGSILVV